MSNGIATREAPKLPEANGNGHGAVSILEVIERASLNPAVDVDKMRALLEMHEHVLDRNAEAAFNAAMTKAQMEMPVVVSDKKNLHTSSKYPSLEAVQRAIKDIYMSHGFTCTFAEDGAPTDGMIHVVGTVRHIEGHSETFHRYAPADTAGPGGKANKTELQGAQSTVSFLQRKLLCAIWGVTVADEDKDGNAPTKLIDERQIADLQALADEVKADIPAFLKYMRVDKIENLPASMLSNAVKALEKKRKKAA
jgi:hypothetical protein